MDVVLFHFVILRIHNRYVFTVVKNVRVEFGHIKLFPPTTAPVIQAERQNYHLYRCGAIGLCQQVSLLAMLTHADIALVSLCSLGAHLIDP